MRFNRKHKELWHSWFAWYPVRLHNGKNKPDTIVWLEWTQRRRYFDDVSKGATGELTWEYILMDK